MLPTTRRPMRGLLQQQQQLQQRARRRLALGAASFLLALFLYAQYRIVTTTIDAGDTSTTPSLLEQQLQAGTAAGGGGEDAHLRERIQGQWAARTETGGGGFKDDNLVAKGGAEPGPVHLRGGDVPRRPTDAVLTRTDAQDEEDAVAHVIQLPPSAEEKVGRDERFPPLSIAEQDARRLAVRAAMQFAWENYEDHAFGGDEVDPKHGTKLANVWGDIACSLVDGMDTLWVMGLHDEFARARDYVADKLRFDHLGVDGSSLSVFETIIREVGGLLSAYELSGDDVFKDKAKELVDLLTPAFDADEGVFYTLFNPYTQRKSFASWSGYQAHIADVGTLQLEMRYLSDITGDAKYVKMGDAFYKILRREGSFKKTGLFPVHFDPTRGKFNTRSSTITLGALGDSFYEYLLKVYMYSGEREEDAFLRELYDDAVRGIEEHLLVYSERDNLYFLQELKVPSFSAIKRMDHLLCFVPGLLALGTLAETRDTDKNARHLAIAKRLMETCYQMYHRQPTGLSPDIVSFPGMNVYDAKYRLRPETIESLFYLYRVTGEQKYREYGWEIFQAIEKHARTEHGYGAVLDVTQLPAHTENKMESFFLAETLKYHYLLQAPNDLLPLDEFVFNTEAHPLRIRKRSG